MRKYIDYLTKKFYANSRYTSSFFYTLKFFFDKNIKQPTFISKLGSVYRGSKWVDLRLQNINLDFLKQFKSIILLIVIIVFIYFFIDVSFLSLIFTKVTKTLLYSIDLLYYS
jgi:hypothetical protein